MPLPDTVPLKHPMALPSGFWLEEYHILRVLGQGGFGITYSAQDTRMNVEVAIKELLPTDFVTRGESSTVVPLTQSAVEDFSWAKQRFIDEARILVRLNHPNIVRVFRFFELNGTAYLVQEYVRGQSLKEWMRDNPQPDEERLKALLLPLLDGLEYVHEEGLLHRDISPENIIVTPKGRPVLLDFGSARAVLGAERKLTSVVRHGFSPIEQYQSVTPQGPYTDLYALAGVMIQAISQTPLLSATDRFGGRDPYQPLITRFRGRYSKPFLSALDLAFGALPKDRPQTVADWRRMLAIRAIPGPRAKAPPLEVRQPPGPTPGLAKVKTPAPSGDPFSGWTRKSLFALLKNTVISGAIVLGIVIIFANTVGDFANPLHFLNIARNTMQWLPAALGLTLLFLVRKVDLSTGVIGALAGVIYVAGGTQWGWGPWPSLQVSLFVGFLCGLVNGITVACFNSSKIRTSFIVTSLALILYTGLTLLVFSGTKGAYYSSAQVRMDNSIVSAISLWFAGLLLVVTQVVLIFTPLGKGLFSLSSPSVTSPRSFWKHWITTVFLFSLSGFLAAVSGVTLAARFGQAHQDILAGSWVAMILAGVVLGGGSLLRARATPLGTLLGLLGIECFFYGLGVAGVLTPFVPETMMIGIAIIACGALIDVARYRKRKKV